MNWKNPLQKQPLRKTFKRLLLKLMCRSSHRRCSVRKGFLRNFSKFTGKHLCQNLFLNKVATLLKKRLWHRSFPVNLAKFLGTPFSQNTSGQLLLNIRCKELFLITLLLQKIKTFLQNTSGRLLLNIRSKELSITALILPENRIKSLYFM